MCKHNGVLFGYKELNYVICKKKMVGTGVDYAK